MANIKNASEKCWKCNGSGQYLTFGPCFRCNGTGISKKSKSVRSATCTCDDPKAIVMCFVHPNGR